MGVESKRADFFAVIPNPRCVSCGKRPATSGGRNSGLCGRCASRAV